MSTLYAWCIANSAARIYQKPFSRGDARDRWKRQILSENKIAPRRHTCGGAARRATIKPIIPNHAANATRRILHPVMRRLGTPYARFYNNGYETKPLIPCLIGIIAQSWLVFTPPAAIFDRYWSCPVKWIRAYSCSHDTWSARLFDPARVFFCESTVQFPHSGNSLFHIFPNDVALDNCAVRMNW